MVATTSAAIGYTDLTISVTDVIQWKSLYSSAWGAFHWTLNNYAFDDIQYGLNINIGQTQVAANPMNGNQAAYVKAGSLTYLELNRS
jgi:hypothetical protein